MRLIAGYLRVTSKPGMATVERARKTIAAPKKPSPPPASLRQRHQVSIREVGGFTCFTVAPRNQEPQRAVVYLHGGAYVAGMSPQHWALVSRLADAGVQVEVPDYGLAPEHTYREAYSFLTAVYREVLTRFQAAAVTIAGDSAGGGLALGFAQTLLAADLPQPRRLLLIAPWLDLTMSNPGITSVKDPWLSKAGLIEAGLTWAGGQDPTDPQLSPINGQLDGLAPMHVYVGTRDLFYPDVLRLGELAGTAPIDITVCKGAVHVYPLVPAPEGRLEEGRIVRLASS